MADCQEWNDLTATISVENIWKSRFIPLSSAEPYEFLVKLRNITCETNYVIVSQNTLGRVVSYNELYGDFLNFSLKK